MIGVVIVTWNSEDVIGACLDACLQFPEADVVVVDNASSDKTCEEVRKRRGIRLVENDTNRGFAGGCNQGIALLPHAAVLLLNPDARLVAGLEQMAAATLAPDVGACGGLLTDSRQRLQNGFNVRSFPTAWTLAFEVLGVNRLAPWNPVNKRYRAVESNGADVDQPAGAFLMINRAAWSAVGGLDEGFHPAWFEDVDFCLRLRTAGYSIRLVPHALAQHIGGHSAAKLPWKELQLFWYGNLLRFACKHMSVRGRLLVASAVMLACIPRAAIATLAGRRSALTVYSKVFLRALDCGRTYGSLSHSAEGTS